MQISFFDGDKPFNFTKPIRLITLFSGYDSQALALKYLGVPFEHYHTCEWAIPSIQALKDLHFGYDNGDFSAGLSKTDLVDILYGKGVSADYNQPLTKEQLNRYGETKLRTIFNNIVATRNLVSICNVSGNDLEIVDTDKYEYIMTYSFPCQDLSAAGLGKGMERGSGTRSGLLWEVERLLKETNELPQVLLMENVKQVIGQKNIGVFADWVAFLDKLGYHSKWKVINATEFGIPQNRERCFMVSVLGNHYYDFPKPIKLNRKLKNVLETNVDKSYYLSERIVSDLRIHTKEGGVLSDKGKHLEKLTDCSMTLMARDYKGFGNQGMTGFVEIEEDGLSLDKSPSFCKIAGRLGGKFEKTMDCTRRVYDTDGCAPTVTTCGGGNTEPKIMEETFLEPFALDEQNSCIRRETIGCQTTDGSSPKHNNRIVEPNLCKYRVRKLTEKECGRLMGVKDEDIAKIGKDLSRSAQYHCFGDSIVTTCLMAIFGQMTDIDYESKIEETVKEICRVR